MHKTREAIDAQQKALMPKKYTKKVSKTKVELDELRYFSNR